MSEISIRLPLLHHFSLIFCSIEPLIRVSCVFYSLRQMGERRDKTLKELRDQLATRKQVGDMGGEKQNFWESSRFKIVVSMSMLILVVFSKR